LDFGNFSEFYMNNLYFVRWLDRNFKFAINVQLCTIMASLPVHYSSACVLWEMATVYLVRPFCC